MGSVDVEFAHVRGAHQQSRLNADDRAVRGTAAVIYRRERERESEKAWGRRRGSSRQG